MMFRCSVLLVAAASLAACDYQPPDRGQPQRVAQDRSGNVYTFGDVEQVPGTRFFTVPIVRVVGSGGGSFSSSSSGSEEHNRLIVDGSTGQSRPILPDSRFEIVNWNQPNSKASNLQDGVGGDEPDPTQKSSGLYTAVIKRPGKSDKEPATYDLLLGRFDTGRQAWIARGLSGVQAVWLDNDGKLALVAAIGGRGIYRLYDPNSFQPVVQSDLKVQ